MQRFAFVVLQSLRKGSYLHDGEISMLSGQLREAGVANDVVEVVFNEASAEENSALLDRLADFLVGGGYTLAAFRRIWDPEIPRSLRRRLSERGAAVALALTPKKISGEALDPYDFVVRGDALRVFGALGRGATLDPSSVPGLYYRDGSGELVQAPGGEAQEGESQEKERWKIHSNFQRIQLNPDVEARPPHVVVYGNPGCPYRRPISAVPFWRDLELNPRQTNTRGCAFCDVNLGDDYRFVADIADACHQQIRWVQDDLPDAYEMILLDQDPFPFLPRLFELLLETGARPLHLLIQARADLFVKRTEHFDRALELARRGGHRLSPFLIGIENFHQPTLDIYNKGVTVEMNVEVLAYLDRTAARFPDVYDRDKVSPGFILWHPWVSFESLRTNVEAIQRHGLTRFRSEVALSKIRLYPDIPFYWKAKETGLLIDSYQDRVFSSAVRYGYPEEYPYRFERPEVHAAYALLAAFVSRYEPIHEIPLLGLILDWVEGRPEYWDDELRLALTEPAALIEAFAAERQAEVLRLRKDNTALRRNRSLSAEESERLRGLVWGEVETSESFALAHIAADDRRTQLFFAAPEREVEVRRDPKSAAFRLILEPRSDAPHFMQSANYNISYSASGDDARLPAEIRRLCARIVQRDAA
jgi:radical SAM superfamily enzyme YgiQ (UPF0313 family)